MPFLTSTFDFTATMKPLDGYTNAEVDATERALALFAEALQELDRLEQTKESEQ